MSKKPKNLSLEELRQQQRRQFGEDLHEAKLALARRLRIEASEGDCAQARDCAEAMRILNDVGLP